MAIDSDIPIKSPRSGIAEGDASAEMLFTLNSLLVEIKKLNIYMQIVTDVTLDDSDVGG